jgi:hypothetical protein
VRLVKLVAGLYLIEGTDWAIGRTDDLCTGPRGGAYPVWELRRKDPAHGWCIDSEPGFRTLREARAWTDEHPEVVG